MFKCMKNDEKATIKWALVAGIATIATAWIIKTYALDDFETLISMIPMAWALMAGKKGLGAII